MQLTHYTSLFKQHTFPITLVCDNITNASNIGSLFRISDAFGVTELILCGERINLGRKMMKTSRATEKVVNFKIASNPLPILVDLKDKGYFLVAIEITSSSKPLHVFNFPKNVPIVLIAGDENFGVSEDILNICDAIIHIDMFGQNSSMNVVQATNIVLYEVTKQLRKEL